MTQDWTDVESTDTIKSSRLPLLNRDNSLKSTFSGTAFPATNLVVGMQCYRTDEGKTYTLISTGPSVWKELARRDHLGSASEQSIGTAGTNVPLLSTENTWGLTQWVKLDTNNFTEIKSGSLDICNSAGTATIDLKDLATDNFDVRLQQSANGLAIKTGGSADVRFTVGSSGAITTGSNTAKTAGSINATDYYKNGVQFTSTATTSIGTSGATIPLLNTSNTWSAGQTITSTGETTYTVKSTLGDTGNTANIAFESTNASENSVATASIKVNMSDITAGSEDATLDFYTRTGGTLSEKMALGQGLTMQGAAGGDQGVGTVNATAVYVGGVEVDPNAVGGGLLGGQVFTSSGTFTVPTDVIRIKVTVIGGGGGGGYDPYGGGGGGGAAVKYIDTTEGAEFSCTIGSGGAGRTPYNSSSSGGTTSFDSECYATGGGAAGGSGGAGSGGTFNLDGSDGESGAESIGGSSPFGGGARAGRNGGRYGGGGGGGSYESGPVGPIITSGGDGAAGAIIIEY